MTQSGTRMTLGPFTFWYPCSATTPGEAVVRRGFRVDRVATQPGLESGICGICSLSQAEIARRRQRTVDDRIGVLICTLWLYFRHSLRHLLPFETVARMQKSALLLLLCAVVIDIPSAAGQNMAGQIQNTDGSTTTIASSLIRGGFPNGSIDQGGNLDADPMLLDIDGDDNIPGSIDDVLGIAAASPALNAGSNALLPPDRFDIDGDGDTSEPIPIDVEGMERSFDPGGGADVVDMGAFESATSSSVRAETAPSVQPAEFSIPFPNPMASRGELTFRLSATEAVEVAVYDVAGRRRLTLYDAVAAGNRSYRLTIPAGDLPSGAYFARLRAGSIEQTIPFVVAR